MKFKTKIKIHKLFWFKGLQFEKLKSQNVYLAPSL